MKKRYLALILILSLLLSACSVVTTPVNTDETNAQLSVNKYRLLNDGICETGDFFFGGYAGGQYLYYYDKENGVSDYLCADPSCAHNTQSCGAFVSRTGLATFYEGKRYWVTYGTEEESGAATLWCSDLGGTNRKRIKKLSYESMGQYAPQVNMIYKGSLYMLGNVNVVEGITVGNRMTLLRTSLDGKEEVEILFDEIFKSNLQYRVNFVGDDAYLGINTWSEDGYDSIKIERIGLSTNHRETVFEEKDIPEMIGKFWITEEGEIYIPGVDKFWKVENGQRTMVSDISEGISPAEIDDGIVLQT